mmetsp:Transcript_15177/g.31208  ORF Transcript_15177/g.31208 Transcript_15177/m.31208 type:complete len:203 (+) Transcript_15177:1288-1896(+)
MSTSNAPATSGLTGWPSSAHKSRPDTSQPQGTIGCTATPSFASTAHAAAAVRGSGRTAVLPRAGRRAASCSACCRRAVSRRAENASCTDMPGGGLKPTCSKMPRASSSDIMPLGVRIITWWKPECPRHARLFIFGLVLGHLEANWQRNKPHKICARCVTFDDCFRLVDWALKTLEVASFVTENEWTGWKISGGYSNLTHHHI